VRLGQEANITVAAFPKRVFKGRIAKIASTSTMQRGVLTRDVMIALANPEHELKPGMTTRVTIPSGTKRAGGKL
jgi:HlyD family secretion protein